MYHIARSKSKVKPFSVILVADNGGVLSQHSLKTKQACWTNIKSQIKGVQLEPGECMCCATEDCFVLAQDDTLSDEKIKVVEVWQSGHIHDSSEDVKPRYVPGKNPKRKNKK